MISKFLASVNCLELGLVQTGLGSSFEHYKLEPM